MIKTQVNWCAVIGWVGEPADPCQYPPPPPRPAPEGRDPRHCGGRPRPRGARRSGCVVWKVSNRLGSMMLSLGSQDRSSGPNLPSTLICHRGVGSSGSPSLCMRYHPQESTEGGVPQPVQDLWRQGQMCSEV